jgi:hypothetical protein
VKIFAHCSRLYNQRNMRSRESCSVNTSCETQIGWVSINGLVVTFEVASDKPTCVYKFLFDECLGDNAQVENRHKSARFAGPKPVE